MNKEDIIKALEYCSEHGMCDDCPYQHKQYDCSDYLKTDALNLIKNQQAEIERLTHNLEAMAVTMRNSANATKIEAYKEFAKLVKNRMFKGKKYDYERKYIDNLVKELTERKEDEKNG